MKAKHNKAMRIRFIDVDVDPTTVERAIPSVVNVIPILIASFVMCIACFGVTASVMLLSPTATPEALVLPTNAIGMEDGVATAWYWLTATIYPSATPTTSPSPTATLTPTPSPTGDVLATAMVLLSKTPPPTLTPSPTPTRSIDDEINEWMLTGTAIRETLVHVERNK